MPITPNVKNGNPNFNFNTQNGLDGGYTTRLKYALLFPITTSYFNDTDNIFDWIQANAIGYYKGFFTYPMINRDIILRFKCVFQYSCLDSNTPLNIKIGWNDSITTYFADQNDNQSHVFAKGEIKSDVPVDLEFTIALMNNDCISMTGHYKYEFDSYNSGGDNTQIAYVPLTPFSSDAVTLSSNCYPILSIYGSQENITINYLTIEEIG